MGKRKGNFNDSLFTPSMIDEFTENMRYGIIDDSADALTNQMLIEYMAACKSNAGKQALQQQKKVRARLAGYLYSILLRNAYTADDTEYVEDTMFFPYLDAAFDYEKEIMAGKWLVPLTGCLYNDLRTNFVAKQFLNKSVDDLLEFLQECMEQIGIMFHDAALNGFKQGYPVFPLHPGSTEEEYEAFFQGLADVKDNETQSDSAIDEYGYIPLGGVTAHWDGWEETFLDNLNKLACIEGKLSLAPKIGNIDTRMVPPEQAFAGINLKTLLREKQQKTLDDAKSAVKSKDFDALWKQDIQITLNEVEAVNINMLAQKSGEIMRERIDYYREQKRIAQGIKAGKKAALEDRKASKVEEEFQRYKESTKATIEENRALKAEIEAMHRKIQALEARNKKLEKTSAEASTVAKRSADIESEKQWEIDALKKEIESLQKLNAEGSSEDYNRDVPLDTSIFNDHNIICVGGHQSWAIGMASLHPNIRYFPSDGPDPSLSAIDNADVIWFQTNCLPHRTFWKVCNRARVNNIPIRYFEYAGHQRCKKQITEETTAIFNGQKERG